MYPGVSPEGSPVTCLEVAGCTVMTGSQGHTVKVFRLDSHLLQCTLNGHCGTITCIFIDQWQAEMGASGCQDGVLCVWDLIRGASMYKIEAHDDSIVALACSPSYAISLGLNERIRFWDRFQGQPLNTMTVSHAYSTLVMLTLSLLVTSHLGSLVVWDDNTGDVAREVRLDCSNSQLSPKIMLPASGLVICDYGNQMRIVSFPLVAAEKWLGPGNRNRPANKNKCTAAASMPVPKLPEVLDTRVEDKVRIVPLSGPNSETQASATNRPSCCFIWSPPSPSSVSSCINIEARPASSQLQVDQRHHGRNGIERRRFFAE
ncbi:sterol regulatory element-binding protein cleavage-activating protein-like [Topomyia yanbarensis]|uniref:sterol regulatory element-binding protein cleavage-activating protein-like n=1 Tax=Topomyia yanbarensis TaxID=2498891 RepID=UPI00273B8BB9|nr:sterol regulatory element-binding protein cleavage-activating protein-like [Topomyia yanbarensis]